MENGRWGKEKKERTHSKGFPENIIKVLRAFNTPVNISLEKTAITEHKWYHQCYQKLLFFLMFFNKFCISHSDGFDRINFTSNKISIKNRTSFICPNYLKNSLFSYGRKLLRCSYLFISINMEFTWTMAKVYRTLIEWRVKPQGSSRLIKTWANYLITKN